jgi:hypothetical protein
LEIKNVVPVERKHYIQDVSGGIVNILGSGSVGYSE